MQPVLFLFVSLAFFSPFFLPALILTVSCRKSVGRLALAVSCKSLREFTCFYLFFMMGGDPLKCEVGGVKTFYLLFIFFF